MNTTKPVIIKSVQKVIKVGSSFAVTIPAKDVKFYGIQQGMDAKSTFEFDAVPEKVTESVKSLDAEYQAFKAQYGQTLKNLADR